MNSEERKKYMKEWKKIHPNYRSEYQKKLRTEIIILLGGKCLECGNSDFRVLEIDSVHGHPEVEKTLKNRNYWGYLKQILEKIKSGSKDYQLLCANCHTIKHFEAGEID